MGWTPPPINDPGNVRDAEAYAHAMAQWDTGKMAGADSARGHNQSTASGKPFWVLDPRPEEIRIYDIAQQLSRVCRFGGALRDDVELYTVAQHCCHVSDHCPPELRLEGLLHDAHEAYIPDLLKPLKLNIKKLGWDWKLLEHPLELAVRRRFGLPDDMHPDVKQQDYIAVATEHFQLQHVTGEVDWGVPPTLWQDLSIEPWHPRRARQEFLVRFYKLYKGD